MARGENRDLIIMPEYRWGGAETQFRAYLAHALESELKTDVIITHGFENYSDELPVFDNGVIRFFEINSEAAMQMHLENVSEDTNYKRCLIYFPRDLRFFDVLTRFNIEVIYSERNDGAVVLNSPSYSDILKKCRFVTCNSEYAAEKLQSKLSVQVLVINNGIGLHEMFPLKENKVIKNILVPARIDRIKNQMRVLSFLKTNDDAFKVTFAGRIQDKPYFLRMKHFIEDNTLEDSVLFCGDMKEMSNLYKETDVVLLSSLCEGTPNVILESYMYGRPVIAMNIEAVQGIVDSRFIYDVADNDGISRCLRMLKDMTSDEYSELIHGNRKKVIVDYSMSKMVAEYQRILRM
ncbi:glycosyltransferase family 4 protein [Butyrivibrio sp. AE3006]|uniref:glycosyltransferase family 4 protein n=1 Tax=Butyrivibrio sp. AE3006 TaxID=1280673 RepID=UPI000427D5E2|nr:glycosyltransferase family 4 protein [Butyrivibrio sp. AE3006]